jgi:serine-type D-Ala-D-Ala carboxypeptidase/endopeptidase
MNWFAPALVLASLIAAPADTPASSPPPALTWGWMSEPDSEYVSERTGDATSPEGATISVRSKSPAPQGYGGRGASLEATALRERVVTVSAELQTRGVTDSAALFLRIEKDGVTLDSDDGLKNALTGDSEWILRSISFHVPSGATRIYFGVVLHGGGAVSARHFRFEAGEPSSSTSQTLVPPRPVPSAAPSRSGPLLEESVRNLVATRVEGGIYPGLVIGVVRGGRQEIYGYGSIADDQKSKPNGDTVFEIGSVTKTFTALLLADAVQRGDVTLEQPVQELLPGYTIPAWDERKITLLDLATQSSGLPNLPENLLPKDPANWYGDYTAEDMKRFLAGYRLPRAPGERYEYSNLGFGLLGMALGERSRAPYAELVRTRIAASLGMNDTASTLSPRMAAHIARGHDTAGEPAGPFYCGAIEGAGALRSTGHDLVAYVRAHMHPPAGPLSRALAVVARPRRAAYNDRVKIALAWQVESRQGREIAWHGGMTGGYSAFVGFTTDGERGIVVLTNVARDVSEIGLAALLPETTVRPQPKEITLPPEVLAEYTGRFRMALGFDLVVRSSGSELKVQDAPVFAIARDEFFIKAVGARLSFERDAAGKVSGVTLHRTDRDVHGTRVTDEPTATPTPRAEIKVDPAELQRYAGRYRLWPGVVLFVTTENGQLFIQVTGQPRVPVFPSAPDEFFYKVVDAQLSFQRAVDGSVSSVVLHQNGQDLKGAREKEQ